MLGAREYGAGPDRREHSASPVRCGFVGEWRVLLSGCAAGFRQMAFVGVSTTGPGVRWAMRSRISVIVSEMSAVTRSGVSSVGSGSGSSAMAASLTKMWSRAELNSWPLTQLVASLSEVAARRSRCSIWSRP
jgi:hypothetical protein